MGLLGAIFFGFLGWLALKAALRLGRIGSKSIDSLFNKIEDKLS